MPLEPSVKLDRNGRPCHPNSMANLVEGQKRLNRNWHGYYQTTYTKSTLIKLLKDYVDKNKHVPTKRDWSREIRFPSEKPFRDQFGGWRKAILAAGFKPPTPRYSHHGNHKIKHGMVYSREYSTWKNMLSRCRAIKARSWKNYGARGISVCNRWNKFENFYADMGTKPVGFTLDRINNDGNYEPSNCRWADVFTQGNNKRDSKKITIDGITRTVPEWSRILNIKNPAAFRYRVEAGWTIKQIKKPIKHYRTKKEIL